MMRHFLRGPFIAAIVLTSAWLFAQLFHIRVILHTLWFISAPPFVASVHSLSFIERCLPSFYGILLPHHFVVRAVVFFSASLCWAAFLSLPFWSRFRIGSLSAIAAESIILVLAVVITFMAFAYMYATFPRPT